MWQGHGHFDVLANRNIETLTFTAIDGNVDWCLGGTRRRTREVLLKLPVTIANYIINDKREHLAQIEARYGMAVRIEGDPHLVTPDYQLEKFKTATRVIPKVTVPVVSM